ncbi:S24/S26 family peptidase [Candidatus Omnitrophota bacterium]
MFEEVLSKNAQFRFKAKGYSMSPFVRGGDVLTISPVDKRTISIGDIVAFVRDKRASVAIHRVVGVKRGHYFIQGDNTSSASELILRKNILGRVIHIERDNKKVLLGLGPERYLIALLNRIGILALLLSCLRSIYHYFKRLTI